MAGVSPNIGKARNRICRLAKSLGYIVTREEGDGVVILTLFWLGPHPHVRLIEIVPTGTPADDPWPLREQVVRSGLAIPDRITPGQVQRVLDLLVDIERNCA